MEVNNFLGSFADENVTFKTQIIKTNRLGEQFWRLMIFIESDRFVDTTASGWESVPGVATAKAISVSVTDYATYASGLLRSWLFDLFATGFTGDCILVACCEKADEIADRKTKITSAYEAMKMYAYHKTACIISPTFTGESEEATDANLDAQTIIELARLCVVDKEFISSALYLPYATQTPDTLESDPIYAAFAAAKVDAFLSCYADQTRNAAVYALGLALSTQNASGTPVGNSFDMWQTSSIGASGPGGGALSLTTRRALKDANIQVWKAIGDNSPLVAAEGAETLYGDVVAANWCVAYITYMSKVGIARLITQPNFFRNNANYMQIVAILVNNINTVSSSGRLTTTLQVPSFNSLPVSTDEIIVDNAWKGYYIDTIRKVAITGRLYIGTEA